MNFFSRKPTAIIIRQLGGIGDVLSLSPVYRGLREKYPDFHIINVTTQIYLSGSLIDIAKHNPFIDDIIEISPFDAATDITKSWWVQFHAADRLENELILKHAAYAADLNIACIQREHFEINHYGTVQTPRYKIWCEASGVVPSSYKPIYEITEEEQQIADEWIAENCPKNMPIVGLGLTSADPKRETSKDKLQYVAESLQKQGCHVVTIDATLKLNNIPYLVGQKIKDLMPIIKRMSAVISVDSGLLHMAGVVGTPIIGLFGPTDYRMRMAHYRGSVIDSQKLVPCAYCWYDHKCLKSPNPKDHLRCLRSIEPELIVNETMKWIRGEKS